MVPRTVTKEGGDERQHQHRMWVRQLHWNRMWLLPELHLAVRRLLRP